MSQNYMFSIYINHKILCQASLIVIFIKSSNSLDAVENNLINHSCQKWSDVYVNLACHIKIMIMYMSVCVFMMLGGFSMHLLVDIWLVQVKNEMMRVYFFVYVQKIM